MTGDWQRVKSVFQSALEKPAAERPAYLSAACGDDDALRRDVASLLASHDEAGEFLSRPALPATIAGGPEDAAPGEARHIGPYRLLDQIGHGGMGTVYRAVRDDDAFRKIVALKIVHSGPSELVERRFRRERQILAQLQHPNVATLLDGGTTPEGRPYLVMEHVEGEPLTHYCDVRGLDARRRLGIFRTVCAAVHYAHQNLVVHRDLKPGNILVTADGTPKLLDFGIAKLVERADESSAPTATLLPTMTPEYASPEQVRGQAVTTASDVYSLGILLYELLAGRRPYEVGTDSLESIVRAVCETQPAPPSTAAAQTPAATWRPSASELRGDLDTIVLKAVRKEPARRYASVHELSEDIGRYLDGRPVLARADTLRYRGSKFVARHRAGVAAAGLVLLSLLLGIAATTRQALIARAERARAENRLKDVRQLANALIFEFHDGIKDLPGSTRLRKQLVERALEYLDRLALDSSQDRALTAELLSGYLRLGRVQAGGGGTEGNLGDREGGLASNRKALALGQRLCCTPETTPEERLLMAAALTEMARALLGGGELPAALAHVGRSTALLEGLTPSRRASRDARAQLAANHQVTGFIQVEQQAWPAVKDSYGRSLALFEAVHREDLRDATARANLGLISKNYGAILQKMGDPHGALGYYQRALELDRESLAEQPASPRARMGVSFGLISVGGVKLALGDARGAGEMYREALAIQEAVLAADPVNVAAQQSVARTRERLRQLSKRD